MRILVRFLEIAILMLVLARVARGQEIAAADLKAFAPLPKTMDSKDNPATPAKIELGRLLYWEPRLSADQKLSCNSCHLLDQFGVDNEPTSDGFRGQKGDRNSPSSFNAAGHISQFWDGRAPTVEEQAKGPILNPVEMAMPSEKAVLDVINSIPAYPPMFAKAFPGEKNPVTYDNLAKAIGVFERQLVTPSRWDQFLQGKKDALTAEEKAGFNQFVKSGCASCHAGAYVGGTMYQKLGVVKPYTGSADPGRMNVTKNAKDKQFFKVPSLRNIVKTAPYLHNGKVQTLNEAITMMSAHQLGAKLKPEEVKSIAGWLNALTGEPPKALTAKPQLPPSGPRTPKPMAD
jgi:cytochrome c peroxidase